MFSYHGYYVLASFNFDRNHKVDTPQTLGRDIFAAFVMNSLMHVQYSDNYGGYKLNHWFQRNDNLILLFWESLELRKSLTILEMNTQTRTAIDP